MAIAKVENPAVLKRILHMSIRLQGALVVVLVLHSAQRRVRPACRAPCSLQTLIDDYILPLLQGGCSRDFGGLAAAILRAGRHLLRRHRSAAFVLEPH